MDFFISPAAAADAATTTAASPGMMDFAFPIILLVLFYFMLIRPQQKRAKEHKAMQSALAKGDEVVTDGGLMGKIIEITDNAIAVQIAENVEVKVRRESVNAVLPKGTLKKL
ncbi:MULTISPECIES: preprotein translocase subunit YajC [Methylophaga]|jgi:preprotein translocase subunit YajC|uniref:Sec translocon accessory complex subunit YajC n=1 Tax=Methylophaga marina TaxID=45495 RepID=A0ABN0TSN6_9GAMM|nr:MULTISPECIES: preprotein translocase subunit YajC [Methylophaga]MAX52863.1 preprotein translocase subunit YajC [Methylophaga sp.]BDZ73333.1 preprotein translocase subunit YajC [Methylophaga marina]|tara:strand:- start:8407 stop:8742 length:336 start_codon:yes stop_codon:yes gene_type:complete